jgi:hypothetical protein
MLHAIQERLDELDNHSKELSEFEQGRQLAFTEVLEIIKTRHEMIWEVLSDK